MRRLTKLFNNISKSFRRTISCGRCWRALSGTKRNPDLTLGGDVGPFADDAFAFLDRYDLPRGNSIEVLDLAVEPPDREICRTLFAEAKVQTEVALRDIGSATSNFIHLLSSVRGQCDPRPNRIAVGHS